MKDIIKIVKSLEDSGLLLKGVSETVQNKARGQKGGFLSMLLGTLGAGLLGDIQELIMVDVFWTSLEIKTWIFNAASSFDKFWNTKI